MTVVDSSVWVDSLRGAATPEVGDLRRLLTRGEAIVGDLIVAEVLQGARTSREVRQIETMFSYLVTVSMVGPQMAHQSAANYRLLRGEGVTLRKTMNVLIGSYCMAHGLPLLHADRDFDPMTKHLGLLVA